MNDYDDDTRYMITFEEGGYAHRVTGDAWITMNLTACAISARVGRAILTNNYNGAEAGFRDGDKIWSDKGVSDLTA